MIMALQVFTDVMALVWQHPFFSCLILLLFTPPFFPIVKFFSPLLISTALFMLALFTMGPHSSTSTESEHREENWEFRRAADVKVWEDKSVRGGERSFKRTMADGNWMDWLSNVQEAGLSWIETKFRNENWKGSALNDDNVSILQEASWARSDPSTSGVSTIEEEVVVTEDRVPAVLAPSMLFKVDSKLKKFVLEKSSEVADFGEDAPGLEDVVEESEQVPAKSHQTSKPGSSVHHEPLVVLQIPKNTPALATTIESPSTDLDDSSDLEKSKRLVFATVRRNSINASSGLSDIDTPVAVATLSKSGKLKQIETLGDLIEDKEHAEKTGEELPAHELAVLKPTIAEQVDDVKEKLEGFTHSSGEVKRVTVTEKPVNASSSNPKFGIVKKAPGSPLFKDVKGTGKNAKKRSAFSDDDSSSGEEELSDSDSDSEFEIFPPVDPKKMKLHPPVKLDIQQLEKKLGTSLSQRTRATPPKGEITEVQ